ncbi:MAG: lysozyme [Caudoviricetes sp.]|nr:MAG: lysozyme [Caudoviricetes sp.]
MQTKFGMEGYFTLTKICAKTGYIKEKVGPFKNIITNSGLERLATAGVLNGCAVGTGSAPESVNDVALSQYLARTSTSGPGDTTASLTGSTVSPYYARKVRVWRFSAGSATGNISEVGVIHTYSGAYPLWSRTLVKDSNGDPVTITVLSDEILDVTYECRVYVYEAFTENVFSLDGVTTNVKTGYGSMSDAAVANILQYGARTTRAGLEATVGVLGAAPNRTPSGTSITAGAAPTYTLADDAANRLVTQKVVFPPGSYTTASGIGSMSFRDTSSAGIRPTVVFEFSPPLVKQADKEVTLTFTISWARHTP